jgi:signal transduction histidine kinase
LLVGNISHDLKTPLTFMSVNLEKLKEDVSGDESLMTIKGGFNE